jgi:hypothetical protein
MLAAVPELQVCAAGSSGCFCVPGVKVDALGGAVATVPSTGTKIVPPSGHGAFCREIEVVRYITQSVDPAGAFTAQFVDAGVLHVGSHVVVADTAGARLDGPALYLTQTHCGCPAAPGGAPLRRIIALVQGLACLHAHGLAHLDVCGSNVLLGVDGRWRLVDFGMTGCFPQVVHCGLHNHRGCVVDLATLRVLVPVGCEDGLLAPEWGAHVVAAGPEPCLREAFAQESAWRARANMPPLDPVEGHALAQAVHAAWPFWVQALCAACAQGGVTGSAFLNAAQFLYDASCMGMFLLQTCRGGCPAVTAVASAMAAANPACRLSPAQAAHVLLALDGEHDQGNEGAEEQEPWQH